MRNYLVPILLIVLMTIFYIDVEAQCAMCKASAEADMETGQGYAREINTGILYLMGIPYFLIATIAILYFRKPLYIRIKSILGK